MLLDAVKRRFVIFSQDTLSVSHRASRCVAMRRDASPHPTRCRPDLARRPRDVARIRERRQASRRRRKRGVRGFMFPLGIPFSCLTAFRFTSTSRRCTWNYRAGTCTRAHTRTHTRGNVRVCSKPYCQAGHETLPDRLPWSASHETRYACQDRLRETIACADVLADCCCNLALCD